MDERLSDTAPDAAEVQLRVLRGLSGAERVDIAYDLSMMLRDVAAARVRQQHPDWSESDVVRQLLREAFPHESFPGPLR